MPDWTRSMRQTFEYYEVDPGTWKDIRKLQDVTGCSMTRDSDDETLGSATLDSTDDVSDKYIRAYLITTQDNLTEKIPLGTYIYQTPSVQYNGKNRTVSQDGYTPLIELKEKIPPLGYAIFKEQNVLARAVSLAKEYARAPVIETSDSMVLTDNFLSDDNDTWLFFVADLVANAQYRLGLTPNGEIMFEKKEDVSVMSPVWTYDDGNSSILYPEIEVSRDLYGVPNVVEVIYSTPDGEPMEAKAINNDRDSIVSVQNRGREVVHRDTNPQVADSTAGLSQEQLDAYAENLLRELSALEYTVTYSHGYCPVRLNDCVMLNYPAAGLEYVKARVKRQIIKCKSGCSVQETAVYTKKLWG